MTPTPPPRPEPSPPRQRLRHPGLWAGLLGLALGACSSGPVVSDTPRSPGDPGIPAPPAAPAGVTGGPAASKTPAPRSGPNEVRTRNAVFKLAAFSDLPGWDKDDIRAGWSAFRYSCEPLQRRVEWREICAASKAVPPTERAMRNFFESHFTVLRILNPDTSREGDVTGYFEPLLEGQNSRSEEFNVPVMGVPRDLYSLDWAKVPAAQRRAVIRVKPVGDRLVPVPSTEAGSYAMDMRRFVLDDRDRRLRLRLVDTPGAPRVEPYYSRAELDTLGLPAGIDAPVLAWVNDPIALYAMQVQGSGRILQPDGAIIRLQYAEQNGHPFRPMRVVAKAKPVTLTRGATGEADTADDFVFEDTEAAAVGTGDEAPLTRGGKAATAPPVSSDGLVDELLKGPKRQGSQPAAPAPRARPAPAGTIDARAAASKKALMQSRLGSDPSFVFFKTVAERPRSEGPQGALGVPLTAGRSVAVDPRVTPLGYPMYLSAPPPAGSRLQVQRLVFAQDTGGAIRGALRADYFWGFGSEAGQLARSTRHRGQMWVMLPNAEAARLASSRLVTRGAAAAADSEGQCLIADGEFCSEVE